MTVSKKPLVKNRIEVLRKRAGWYWRIVAVRNGQVRCHSEQYAKKGNAKNGAKALLHSLKTGDFVMVVLDD